MWVWISSCQWIDGIEIERAADTGRNPMSASGRLVGRGPRSRPSEDETGVKSAASPGYNAKLAAKRRPMKLDACGARN